MINTYIFRVLEKEYREKGAENLFEEIIAENFVIRERKQTFGFRK